MIKPRILLLVDKPGWAFDFVANALLKYLGAEFDLSLEYVINRPILNSRQFDLIYVFWWGETYHQKFIQNPDKVVKGITSHRWAIEKKYGFLSPKEFVDKHLSDAGTITVVSKRLEKIISPHRKVYYTPEGFDTEEFRNFNQRRGKLRIGWAGNIKDKCKGVREILRPAAFPRYKLHIAGGTLQRRQMSNFYNSIDVICVASIAEGQPAPLIEGMASGCFPVSVDVGIINELVNTGHNGLIIARNCTAFRSAFSWCRKNIDEIRSRGKYNAEIMIELRSWPGVINYWNRVFTDALK